MPVVSIFQQYRWWKGRFWREADTNYRRRLSAKKQTMHRGKQHGATSDDKHGRRSHVLAIRRGHVNTAPKRLAGCGSSEATNRR